MRQFLRKVPLLIMAFFAVAVFLIGYLLPAIRYYTDFNLNTFDYAILYEGVMRFTFGESTFLNTRGVHALADNQEYLQFLWAWIFLFSTPHFALLISHALIFLVSTYVFTKPFLKKNSFAVATLAIAFLMHPVPYRMANDIVHAEAFNFLFVPLMVLALFKGKKKWTIGLTILICLVKEDSCLYVAFFWLVHSAFHWKDWRNEKGLMVLRLAIPMVAFLLDYFVVLPYFLQKTCEAMNLPFVAQDARPANPWFEDFYRAENKFLVFFEHLWTLQSLKYLALSFWPVLFYRRRFLWLAVASAGQIGLNILSGVGYLNGQAFHYDHFVFPVIWMGLMLSFSESSVNWRTLVKSFAVLAIVLGLSKNLYFFEHPNFWNQVDRGFEIIKSDDVTEIELLHQAIGDVSVSADYISVAYLQKPGRIVSMFPNTLQSSYYGVRTCDRYPSVPDLVILNERSQQPEYLEILAKRGYVLDPRFSQYQRYKVWKISDEF